MIREAKPEDIERVMQLGMEFLMAGPYKDQVVNQQYAGEMAMRVLQSDAGHILVSEEDGLVTGVFAFILYPHYFSGELTACELIWYVSPEYRKGGSALHLLAAAENLSRNLGAKRMQLTAPTEKVGRLFHYCGGYEQLEVCYQRRLN